MNPALPVLWLACAAFVLTGAVRARSTTWGLRTGLLGVATLFLVGGAVVNATLLATGEDYADFADGASTRFVRDTWRSLVVPHHTLFITLLIVFELAVGVLVLGGRTPATLGLWAAIGFHLALVSFGWGFLLWSVPMVAALLALLRALHAHPALAESGPCSSDARTTPQ